ncbi:hypothetical protein [Roseibium suaedae]|uniref:Glycosyltransferase RgtA/B/C/D-like domain-containing protein n=1 Tax=Roseibium suaedae TaxID=735517 RepID=A0A1M7FDR3_9HYPH|nr:hypothetical protein [Roseibium suaedae]SHM01829.1 hypothetical protein SAMN05444272_1573 [Roseibium suaedae]
MIVEFLIAVLITSLFFARQGNVDLNPGDEGYLAHGITRMHMGQIPIRDFKSYDPFRYYWCYVTSFAFGRGLIAIRRASAAFLAIALCLALIPAHQAAGKGWPLVPLAALILIWAFQLFKSFDISASLISVAVGAAVINHPTTEVFLISGVWVVLACTIGLMHGIYAAIGIFGLITASTLQTGTTDTLLVLVKNLGLFIGGIAIGLCPLLLKLGSISKQLLGRFGAGSTSGTKSKDSAKELNISLPVPMPWHTPNPHAFPIQRLSQRLVGLHFLVLPLFYLTTIFVVSITSLSEHPLLAASTFIGLPYLHHAYKRADIAHLSQSIAPFLLAISSVLYIATEGNDLYIGLGSAALLVLALLTVSTHSPILAPLLLQDHYRKIDINGETFNLQSDAVTRIASIRDFISKNVDEDQRIFVAPYEPLLYEVVGKLSPVRNDCLFTVSTAEEQNEIVDRLKENQVAAAFINNFALDNKESRRFSSRCEIVWNYLEENFDKISMPPESGETAVFFKRKVQA